MLRPKRSHLFFALLAAVSTLSAGEPPVYHLEIIPTGTTPLDASVATAVNGAGDIGGWASPSTTERSSARRLSNEAWPRA